MSKNVVEFEPSIALFVPNENPLEFYERIESISRTYLKPRGLIYLEINELLGSETLEVYNNNLFSQAYLINDMFGKNRFIKAMKL